ncbi:MAG TPA: class I SAM-dependent methyltransferase [Terracidiphilus sp.]|nr:class I SAM-dependent methyltransferase [Terracidiphilus sp.]
MTQANPQEPARKRTVLPGLTRRGGFTLHPFDLEHGVRTSGLIPGRHLRSGHRHDRHATAYFGVAPSVFLSLLRRWQRLPPEAPTRQFHFLDVGAGMGRAMLLASELPFARVTGIELNPTLARIARRNLTIWRTSQAISAKSRPPMKLMLGDAVDFAFPDAPCLLFCFNPFGEAVMRRLLRQITRCFASRPGWVDLIYVNNEQERVLEMQSGFTRLFLGQVRRSRADAIADHRIMANQPDGEYMASNYEDCSIWRWTGKPTSGRTGLTLRRRADS